MSFAISISLHLFLYISPHVMAHLFFYHTYLHSKSDLHAKKIVIYDYDYYNFIQLWKS